MHLLKVSYIVIPITMNRSTSSSPPPPSSEPPPQPLTSPTERFLADPNRSTNPSSLSSPSSTHISIRNHHHQHYQYYHNCSSPSSSSLATTSSSMATTFGLWRMIMSIILALILSHSSRALSFPYDDSGEFAWSIFFTSTLTALITK